MYKRETSVSSKQEGGKTAAFRTSQNDAARTGVRAPTDSNVTLMADAPSAERRLPGENNKARLSLKWWERTRGFQATGFTDEVNGPRCLATSPPA